MSQRIRKTVLTLMILMPMCLIHNSALAGDSPFIGEVSWVPYNFAPRGWAFCNGALLPISQNTALFSLLGTTYGGDGRVTFGLPNVQDRIVIHRGQGAGLTHRQLGEQGGSQTETLAASQLPSHTHKLRASSGRASKTTTNGNVLANTGRSKIYVPASSTNSDMHTNAVASTGASQPQAHDNMPPVTTLHCVIALQGVFPSRP